MTWSWPWRRMNKAFVVDTKSASLPLFTDANINIMVFDHDQRHSLRPGMHSSISPCTHSSLFSFASGASSSRGQRCLRCQRRPGAGVNKSATTAAIIPSPAGIASHMQHILAHSTRDSSPQGVSCRFRVRTWSTGLSGHRSSPPR
jgi:hypothetical protein